MIKIKIEVFNTYFFLKFKGTKKMKKMIKVSDIYKPRDQSNRCL